ncbi:MAG: plasmid recombination protein [Bacteroidaceae bacterium]|nr:plasmid recombination protein [Bacteroidaceae bacterium]
MEKKQKQVCDIRAGKGMSIAQSNEHLRVGQENAYLKNLSGTFDPTREKLNFEIGRGGVIQPLNKGLSITRRIKDNLKERGIKDPNEGLSESDPKRRRTIANIILQGSQLTMRKLAFGEQDVNWEKGADNSHITRCPEIEQWATDMYNFVARKYGEENIAAFVVHLDETNPHIHCTLLPITTQNKFSWKQVFAGDNKDEYSRRMKQLHDELAAINERWGLQRGDSTQLTGTKHKSYNQWLDEVIKGKETTINTLNMGIKQAETRLKGLTKMLSNLETKKSETEIQIAMLEEKMRKGEIKHEDITEQIRTLQAQVKDCEEKIEDKKTKLKTAENQLEKLLDRKAEVEDEIMSMQQQINRDLPTLHMKTVKEMDATLWRVTAEEAKEMAEKIPAFYDTLSPTQREEFNNIFDNSFFEIMAEKANETSAVAAALFLGYVDQAVNFAQAHGGGGGGGSNASLKRKEDEDDLAWRRRCAIMGMHLMRSKGTKRSVKR